MPSTRPFEEKDQNRVMQLFFQLTGKPVLFDTEDLLNDENCHAIVVENEDAVVVGFASLIIHRLPTRGLVARIEDVVVDESQRGKGYGRMLMEKLLDIAKERKISEVDLTSNPSREAARKLYESMGFKLRDTGVFRIEL
ncbi:MAG TPA: GNAT family N-acetyltransferase [Patescibacteria group bacterium]